jgi:hypothetical protein
MTKSDKPTSGSPHGASDKMIHEKITASQILPPVPDEFLCNSVLLD